MIVVNFPFFVVTHYISPSLIHVDRNMGFFPLYQFLQAFPWEGLQFTYSRFSIASRWSEQPPYTVNITVGVKIVVVAIQVEGSYVINIHHRLDFGQRAGYRVEPKSSMTIYSTNFDSFFLSLSSLPNQSHCQAPYISWNFYVFSSSFLLYFKIGFWCWHSWTSFLNSHVMFSKFFFKIC
jgi:hypothetical protein